MDAVGSTPSILHLVHQCFIHIQQARAFQEEFEFYQLQLKVHLSRCATVSRIIYEANGADNILAINAIDGPEIILQDQEPTMAEIISAIQSRLRKAQQEAAKLEADFVPPPLEGGITTSDPKTMRVRMTGYLDKRKVQAAKTIEGIKWAFYKKDKHEKFITDISALIKHLERKVNTIKESQRLDDTRIMYIARARTSIM